MNNTAGSIGSTLYGGQLDKCRLYYRTSRSVDRCAGGNKPYSDNSNDAIGVFKNISQIIQFQSATSISSQVVRIKFCQDGKILDDIYTKYIKLYPGERFNVTVIALDQNDYPVPTTISNQNDYEGDDFQLRPSSQRIVLNDSNSCTNITFQQLKKTLKKYFNYIQKIFVRALLII